MIELPHKTFKAAAAMALSVVERRNSIPILDALKVRANGALSVTGTDLDIEVTATVPYEGKPTTFVLPSPRPLLASVAAAGGDIVNMAVGDALALSAGPLKMQVRLPHSPEDFPALSPVESGANFSGTLGVEAIDQILKVATAASVDANRYYLHGIYFERLGDWSYRATATDGHRLIYADLAIPDGGGLEDGILIPRKVISLLARLRRQATDGIHMSVRGQVLANREDTTAPARRALPRILFAAGIGEMSVEVDCKVIDGTFPDYRRVIPANYTETAVVDAGHLLRAARAVGAGARRPCVTLTFLNSAIRVGSTWVDAGATAAVDVTARHNVPIDAQIGVNGEYLASVVSAVAGDTVALSLASDHRDSSPILLRDPDACAMCAVLMPMRF